MGLKGTHDRLLNRISDHLFESAIWLQRNDLQMLAAGELATITRYQGLGCWEGGIEIPQDLYEQALSVFQSAGAIA